MKIVIIIGEATIAAELDDSPAARSLAAQLPLDVELKDYHGIEKVFDPPSRLSTDGAPRGYDPDVGDITYFAPWGNVAIFYRDFDYSSGLVPLGRIEGDMTPFAGPKARSARIERADEAE